MPYDIQALKRKLDSASQITYGGARGLWPFLQEIAEKLNTGQWWLDWWNIGGNTGSSTTEKVLELMRNMKEKLFDSGRDPHGWYEDWEGMKEMWLRLAIQANAVGVGIETQVGAIEMIPSDVADAAIDVVETVVAPLETATYVVMAVVVGVGLILYKYGAEIIGTVKGTANA